MKGLLRNITTLAMVLAIPFASLAQFNLSFESWNSNTYFSHPSDYHSNVAEAYLATGSPHITEVSGQSGSAVRLENVSNGSGGVITAKLTKGPLFDPQGEAESYTGDPTSVTVRYKPQLQGNDSARIQFIFKNALDNQIEHRQILLGGNSSSWQEITRNFNITGSPAKVNIIIESFNQSQSGSSEVGSAIEIDNIEFDGTSEQPGNSGFDDWYDVAPEEPDNWLTPNFIVSVLAGQGSSNTVTKSSMASDGSFAAQIQTVEIPFASLGASTKLEFGFVTNGQPALFGNSASGGIPHTAQSTNLTFDYKYQPEGNDQAVVNVTFSNSNGDSINGGYAVLPAASSFTEHEMTFDWSGISEPDSLLIYFSSSGEIANASGNAGSTLTIDNLQIDGASGIGDVRSGYGNGVSISPNPAGDFVNLQMDEPLNGTAQLRIFDILGRVVKSGELTGSDITTINLENMNSGYYIYEITTDEQVYSGKFTKR